MTPSMKQMIEWLKERGGECAVARVKGGGRIFLARGETAPFLPKTARNLIDAGLAEYVDKADVKAARFRLIGPTPEQTGEMT
jgi:hypothetical protein